MGIKPLGKCSENFCQERAVNHGRCAKHVYKAEWHKDPFYGSTAWLNASKAYLDKHPLCVKCMQNGRAEPATLVDHKTPWKQGGDKWKSSNWAALCASCHGLKRSYELAKRSLEFYS